MIRADRKIVFSAAAALAIAAAAVWLYHESTDVTIRGIRVELPYFSPADDGLAVAVLSDTHFGPGDAARSRSIARRVNDLAPDLVLLLGDFVNGSADPRASLSMDDLAHFCSLLHAKYGVFAVTGNKEMWYGRDKIIDALRRGNVEVLTGKSRFVVLKSGQRLQLAGLPDHTTELDRQPPVIAEKVPTIVLMHDANSAGLAPESAFGVAGHTHGGQFRLAPDGDDSTSLRLIVLKLKKKLGMGGPLEDSRVLFDRGFTSFRGRRLFITSGLGAERVKLRVFCPPEIVLVHFYAADAEAAKNRYTIPEEL